MVMSMVSRLQAVVDCKGYLQRLKSNLMYQMYLLIIYCMSPQKGLCVLMCG